MTGVDWALGRRSEGFPFRDVVPYALAQITGAIFGAVLANVMFDIPTGIATDSTRLDRFARRGSGRHGGPHPRDLRLVRSGRGHMIPGAVGAYIGAAYWFTELDVVCQPRGDDRSMFSDTFAGIDPSSVPPFIVAQVLGAALGAIVVTLVFPEDTAFSGDVRAV